jgi:hypothetical protein
MATVELAQATFDDVTSDAVFGKVDTEPERASAGEFGISSIPMLMVIREVRTALAERSGAAKAAGA